MNMNPTLPKKANIITVSGAHSGVGKTRVAEMLLKELKGWSGLKVTVLHNGACPTGRDCGACDEMGSKFSIVTDKNIIEEKNKDTHRLKAKGAKEVFWLKAKPEGLREGLKKAISNFKSPKGIIVEGNSVLKYLKPDLAIFVKRNKGLPNVLGETREKNSAQEAFKKADLVITLGCCRRPIWGHPTNSNKAKVECPQIGRLQFAAKPAFLKNYGMRKAGFFVYGEFER